MPKLKHLQLLMDPLHVFRYAVFWVYVFLTRNRLLAAGKSIGRKIKEENNNNNSSTNKVTNNGKEGIHKHESQEDQKQLHLLNSKHGLYPS